MSSEATRAVTIEAPRSAVWPWLVQIGFGRGGFYSYDRLDNAGRPSAREIHPELQDLQQGDSIKLDRETSAAIATLEPERAMVMFVPNVEIAHGGSARMSQAFIVEDAASNRTRLICRMRAGAGREARAGLYVHLVFEPVDFLMMRRQLLGIKERAEGAARSGGQGEAVEA